MNFVINTVIRNSLVNNGDKFFEMSDSEIMSYVLSKYKMANLVMKETCGRPPNMVIMNHNLCDRIMMSRSLSNTIIGSEPNDHRIYFGKTTVITLSDDIDGVQFVFSTDVHVKESL